MVSLLVISPVGTSLFRNFASSREFAEVASRYGVGAWATLPLDSPENAYPGGALCRYAEDRELMDSLRAFVSADPRRSCAELAGFYEILEEARSRYGALERVAVSLYATATCNSYLASKVIAAHLESAGFGVGLRVVEAIRSEEDFDEGLASLLDAVAEDVVEFSRRGFRVFVNATPGFKPEATFLVVASLLLGVSSVYYIHEAFRRAVRIPALPLSVRGRYLDVVRRLVEEGGVELWYAYNVLGLTEADVRDLEDRYVAYVEGTRLKPRRWAARLVEALERLGGSQPAAGP